MSTANDTAGDGVAVQRFALKGRVVSTDTRAKTITINHEAIPGFMGAMTMAYPVRDSRLLDHVSPGQPITATVIRQRGEYWLENIANGYREGPRSRILSAEGGASKR